MTCLLSYFTRGLMEWKILGITPLKERYSVPNMCPGQTEFLHSPNESNIIPHSNCRMSSLQQIAVNGSNLITRSYTYMTVCM